MSTNLDPEIHRICLDSEGNPTVSVYLRQLAKGAVFYARYKIQKRDLANGQRFITESLKTDNLDIAIQKAQERHAEIRFAQAQNIGLKDITVEQSIKQFVENYERNVAAGVTGWSRHMLAGFRFSLCQYWTAYIGNKQLSMVTVRDFEEYEIWRKEFAKKRALVKSRIAESQVARTTLKLEIGAFKQCLRWLKDRNLYVGTADTFRFRTGPKAKRSAFTVEQYRKLIRYMRTSEFSRRAKSKSDVRHERYRQVLRAYVLFMASSGLRVGEARWLKWEDVTEQTNSLGQRVAVIRVSASASKVRKSRSVVGRNTASRAVERLRQYLVKLGETVTPDKYIFSDEFGAAIHSFGIGFRTLLKNAGVEHDAEGRKHTIYSLRHTYITFRLMFGKNISVYHLAGNCGTSVAMIEQYYSDARPQHFVDELTI